VATETARRRSSPPRRAKRSTVFESHQDAHELEAGRKRTAADRSDPIAPVAPLGVLDGHRLSLTGVPGILSIGQPLATQAIDVFADLLDRGALPALGPAAGESCATYLGRCLKRLADMYRKNECPLDVEFGDRHEGREHDGLVVTIATTEPFVINVRPVDRAIYERDPLLAASIFHHLAVGGRNWPRTIGPHQIFSVAEFIRFYEPDEYFDQMRTEIAQEHEIEPDRVRLSHIKAYLRTTNSLTPGGLRRMVGAHHYRIAARPKRALTIARCRERVANLPARLKSAGTACLDAAQQLQALANRLSRSISKRDIAFLQELSGWTLPALILETSIDDSGIITELVDELFQYVSQSDEFDPSHVMILKRGATDAKRLRAILDLFAEAYAILWRLSDALDRFGKYRR